ncbi:MAG TPA: CRTAC1 family protein [Planctomycetota bacterium]|nr:CRTAC1 family protein [Planctomycetota bacterium]
MSAARRIRFVLAGVAGLAAIVAVLHLTRGGAPATTLPPGASARRYVDTSGFSLVGKLITPWDERASLEDVAAIWDRVGFRLIDSLKLDRPPPAGQTSEDRISGQILRAAFLLYEGDVAGAGAVLAALRANVEPDPALAREWLPTIAYVQGVTALRRGENDNCVDCRGASACILPIAPSAVHGNQAGSREAVRHFTEILEAQARDGLPDDLEVRWLLNLACMTLGEWPDGVDPRFRLPLEKFLAGEEPFVRFDDISDLVGLDRMSEAGGAILEDLDGDGLLDVVVSTMEPMDHLSIYLNRGDGTFEDRTEAGGVRGQLGGLYCVQTDFDNDGRPDIYVARGGWLAGPLRQSLLRNRGDFTFEDVTVGAGLGEAVDSHSVAWGDYDNDGFLDLFVCCEQTANLLYRNRGDGTFEERATLAGVAGGDRMVKGAVWIDYDNDDWPDLFVNILAGRSRLYHNERDGTFREVTRAMQIDGPQAGFACWAFDFDNDGWLDIFATSYDRSTADVVKGLIGMPHDRERCRLYRNLEGRGFKDMAKEAGLDGVYETMGCNFGDLDGDGFLDIYLGTGEPEIGTIIPNRMFRNMGGTRFADVTARSGTGHLQKGHGVSCGDWDRDGDLDMLVELGGAVPVDRYHNVLFQNPGAGNGWITLKLVGAKTNRAAIGARIRVVTEGERPLTIHRHVTTGGSFGANPLEQTIGLGDARRIARLEIRWPTSGTTQVFRDVPIGQMIEIKEFADSWRRIDVPRLTPPSR